MTCWKINGNDDIWNKVNNSISKELDCEPIYNKRFLKTKIRSCSDKATNFYSRKLPGADPNYIYWLAILIDSVKNKDENYYPQVFLKDCKKCFWKMVIEYITDDLIFSSDEPDKSDEE